jgi:hypothetical protein
MHPLHTIYLNMQSNNDKQTETDNSPNLELFHLAYPASQQLTALDVHL